MPHIKDDQFHENKSFSKGNAPRPGGEPDESLEGMGEDERPIVAGGSGVLHDDAKQVRPAATGDDAAIMKGSRSGKSLGREMADDFLDPSMDGEDHAANDPEGMLSDYNRGENQA
jgi:hypothetical protein